MPGYIPSNGLVAYLPFDGNAEDASNAKTGFENIGVDYDTIPGNSGSKTIAARFRGTDETATYLLAKDVQRFMTEQFSFSATIMWQQARPQGSSKMYQGIVCLGAKNWTWGPAYYMGLEGADNSILSYGHWTEDPTGRGEVHSQSGAIALNQWQNVIVTYDGVVMRVYLDGKLIGTDSAEINYDHHDRFILGGLADNPDGRIMGGFIGLMDDFAFWNRALNDDEIARVQGHCNLDVTSDSILGYRKVETHQVVTYALRNRPELSYKWTATGGYLLGPTRNHFCDVIWGYDKAGSVCCIVSDSTCSDTLCVQTTITEKNTVNVDDITNAPTLVVRPNPVSDVLQIDSRADIVGSTYDLIDVTGRRVLQAQGPSAQLSLVSIAEGVYHVVHRDAAGTMIGMQRVVVRR